MRDLAGVTPDLCAALVTPQIDRLTFAVVHASIGRAGPQLMRYGVPVDVRRWRRVTTWSARLCLRLIQIARALVHVLYTLGVR